MFCSSGSITIANMIFTGCNRTGNVVVIDSQCNDRSARRIVRFVHIEFRNHVVSDDQRLLETSNPSCTDTIMENVLIRENQCESGCLFLSQNNTLRDIRVNDNQVVDDENARDVLSVFMMPVNSETVATNISASRNEIRLFSILDSRFTLRESNFNSNTIVSANQPVFESTGGSVLLSNSSTVDISDSVFVNNTGWNGGVFCAMNETSFNVSMCIFSGNNANHGAGLYASDMQAISCNSVKFVENNARQSGGGARVAGFEGGQSFDSCRFMRNTAEEGGCLAGSRTDLRLANILCEESIAMTRGGGLFFDRSNVRIRDTEIISSRSRNFGGILASEISQIVGRNLSSNLNIASEDGGGIGIVNRSSLLCSQCKFQHNMATRGAGLFIEADDSLPLVAQLQDSSVLNNSATTLGGNGWY